MYNQHHSTKQNSQHANLSQNPYQVSEIGEKEHSSKNHQILKNEESIVSVYLNQDQETKKQYYEIVYNNKRQHFRIYHSENNEETLKVFDKLKSLIVTMNKSLRTVALIVPALESMMNGLKQHPDWSATHLAALLGLEAYFTHCTQVEQELNLQISPDLMTPVHLAVINLHVSLVDMLAQRFTLDLDLVDANHHSILHLAAISSGEMLSLVLSLPDMFNRILWKDVNGSTALHLSCFAENFVNICEFLKFGLTAEMLTLPTPKLTLANGKADDRPKPRVDMKVIKFTEPDLYDFDFTPSKDYAPSDIASVGSILHWVKNHRLMEKLLKYKFDVNVKNLNGDTPLHIMVKRDRFLCVLTLLCHDARVEAKNIFGNTALHHAISGGNKAMTQTLIVFDADIDAKNNKMATARHEASTSDPADDGILLFFLSSIGAKRCPTDMIGCKDGCKHDGKFEGRFMSKLFKLDSDRDNFFQCPNIEKVIKETIAGKEVPPIKGHRVNLLSFDGGGIKGVLSLQAIIEVEKCLKHPITNYFRWLTGTSTGSIIAACLANGKTTKHVRNLYFNLKSKLFNGQRPYSSELLEKFLKDEFGTDLTLADLRMKHNKNVIIPAVLFDRNPMHLHIFRSYQSSNFIKGKSDKHHIRCSINSPNDASSSKSKSNVNIHDDFYQPPVNEYVWKTCRASGAAPTYFSAFGPFIDGGMIANNPTLDALTEIQNFNVALDTVHREKEHEHLNLVLSLGCGRFPAKKTDLNDLTSMYTFKPSEMKQNLNYMWNFFNMMLNEVCMTNDHVVHRAEAACSRTNTPYFRINALLSQDIDLDEKYEFKIINAMWEVKRYMYFMKDQMLMLANYLELTTDLAFAADSTLERSDKKTHESVPSFTKNSSKTCLGVSSKKSLSSNRTGNPSQKSVKSKMHLRKESKSRH